MTETIINPFVGEQNRCFGCSPENPAGLKLEFEEDENSLFAIWQPSENYQGYPGVLHGGIIATLLDETAAWFVYVKLGTAGVTKKMCVTYHKPAFISKGKLKITAKLSEKDENSATIKCMLTVGDGTACAEAEIVYHTFPAEIAVKRYRYPGREAFYKKYPGNGKIIKLM